LNAEAFQQYQVGAHADALRTLEGAIELLHEAEALGQRDHRAVLAMSLANRSNCQTKLGLRDAAHGSAVEAVALYEKAVADDRSESMLARLAMALANLTETALEVSENSRAASAASESAAIYDHLAGSNPSKYTLALVHALAASGRAALESGSLAQAHEAHEALERAIGLARSVSNRTGSDAAELLSGLLNDKANVLRQEGRLRDALTALEDSLDLTRPTEADQPIGVLASRGRALASQATCLAESGQRDAALLPAGEAVVIYRVLASRDPAYMKDLAIALNNHSNRLAENGHLNDSLDAVNEAIGVYRHLGEGSPASITRNLVSSLSNLSNRLAVVGEHDAALSAASEAARIADMAAALSDERTFPGQVEAWTVLAARLEQAERQVEAGEAATRAAEAAVEVLSRTPGALLRDGGTATLAAYERLTTNAQGAAADPLLSQLRELVLRSAPK
jgi:tetratricopeptide (TPR) repeat protein